MINSAADTHSLNNSFSNEPQHFESVRPLQSAPSLSFVIPVMNEQETLQELLEGIMEHVPSVNDLEVVFIDDGSTDRSWDVIRALADEHPTIVRGIQFRSNRGKAVALQTGFEAAQGDVVFTMDADLQDDPQEIPRFLQKIEEGFDLVSGWKAVRHDPWHKVLPSRIFNRMLSRVSTVTLHDHNCGFKCYRREVVRSIRLFGELHRMAPALAGMHGFRVTEIVVEHHARQHGVSKYGIERFIRGFSDMLTVGFLRVYHERPSHFANLFAGAYGAAAALFAVSAALNGVTSLSGLLCLLTAVCLVGMGGACVLAGLLGELMIRQTLDSPSPVVFDTSDSSQTQPTAPSTEAAFSGSEKELVAA